MFSYEARLRAVQFYIKLGKWVGLTIRQLGFPTKNLLKHWCTKYEQGLGLATGSTRASKYSQAQKEFAVAHYLGNGRCFAATIKSLGYPSRTLLPFCVQELHPQIRSPIIHCFDGMVVRWTMRTRPDAEFVNTMLDAASETVTASNERSIVHSDRGAH